MRIYALIPKLSSDSVAFIYSSSASVSLSLLFFSRPHRPSPIKFLIIRIVITRCRKLKLSFIIFSSSGNFVSNVFVDLGEVVTDGEKSKAGKKRAKAPWAKPLSQYSQGLAVCSSCNIFSKGLVFQFMRNEFSCLHVRFFYSFLPTKLRNFLEISR
uniref:Uncharacterized protein n=1 Tax=Brassica campestris TaxID=3711 RepID=A0A3P6DBG0_BRACM|nr:unnamed protein product [Brassica rapa]